MLFGVFGVVFWWMVVLSSFFLIPLSWHGVFLFFVVFWGRNKIWMSVACHGVLCFCCSFLAGACALVFLFSSPSCHGVSFFLNCFFGGTKKVDQCFRHCFWSFIRALGHGVLWFCFLVALRFECTLAPLVFFVFSLPAGCVFGGTRKGGSVLLACCMPWCFMFLL